MEHIDETTSPSAILPTTSSSDEAAGAAAAAATVGQDSSEQRQGIRRLRRPSLSVSEPEIAVVGGCGSDGGGGHRRSQSATHISHVVSPALKAMMAEAQQTEAAVGMNRLAGVEASVAWMFSPQAFSHMRRGRESKGDGNEVPMDRRVRKFYKQQDQLIDTFGRIYNDIVQADDTAATGENGAAEGAENADAVAVADADAPVTEDADAKCSIRLAQLSFFVNLALTIIKAAAIGLSGSLSVVSSLIDSLIDLVSGIVVWIANRQVKTRNPYYYPQGKTRLEPIAIVILAVLMSTSTVQIIIKAIENIITMAVKEKTVASNSSTCPCANDGNGSILVTEAPASASGTTTSWPYVFGLVVSVIILKAILFVLCYKLGTTSSTDALALDHRNDVISNTTVLVMTILSAYVWPFFDSIGAVGISIYIIYTWVLTLKQQIRLLTGYTADSEYLKQITFICVNHHPLIEQLDTVRAFHIGNNFLVEVDIVVPGDLPLREAHDIGESLQRKLERLDWVERAFVHVDYEYLHHPSTEHKQV